jgi:oligopeptide transport system substrate-binding protein
VDWAERWYRELGVRTHLIYEPAAVRAERMTPAGDYDVLYGNLIATVPDAGDLLSGFLWPAEYSETKWLDKEFVRLMDEANRQTGTDRLRLLEKAERRAMEAVPAVPMMFEQRQALLAAEVQGWYADPLARQSLKRLRLETTAGMNSNPGPRL